MKSIDDLHKQHDIEVYELLVHFRYNKRKLVCSRIVPCLLVLFVVILLVILATILTFCMELHLTPLVIGCLLLITCPLLASCSRQEIEEYEDELFKLLETYVKKESAIDARYGEAIEVARVYDFYCTQNQHIVELVRSVFDNEDEAARQIYNINIRLSEGCNLEEVLSDVLSSNTKSSNKENNK